MGGEDIIEVSTETSEVLIGSLENGVFVAETLEESVSAFASVVSGVDELILEVRCELIAGEYCGSDLGAELFSEALGKGIAVVFVVVRHAHDGVTVCVANTLELRFCVSCCFGSS